MKRYSVFSLARNAVNYHKDWGRAWRSPEPKPAYDAVIVGAGGHGLATAYYLAKEHKLTNIAVIEKGWLGGGNTGRNTTIIRSNYLQDASIAIYELARSLYEDLSQELNYNVMFSPRGLLMLCQTEHELRAMKRTSHANRLAGLDCRMISPAEVKQLVPIINDDPGARYPILGAYYQPRGGTARHDAVAWGYARGADAMGVDIIQNCEVTGIRRDGAKVSGIETSKGFIATPKIGVVVAGHTSLIMQMAGVNMPIESVCLQALVSEPIKPVIDVVVMANTVHGYMSQSDKGELVIGGGADPYNNYSQRGSFPALEHTITALVETFPIISRLSDAAPLGRHRRHDGRPLAHHLQDRRGRALRQLRLGNRRLQDDPGLGLRLCRHHGQRPPASHRRALRAQPLHRGPADRRKRRSGRGALRRTGQCLS